MKQTKPNGFTLLEVMIGLALLGFVLVVLIKHAVHGINGAIDSQLFGVATDLSRSKMNDIEEMLLKEGFTDTDQSLGECGDPKGPNRRLSSESELEERDREVRARAKTGKSFEDEGWPKMMYTYRIDQVELPSWDELQAMTQKAAAGSGADGEGSGSDGGGDAFSNSALGGMLSQLGGGGGQDIDAAQGASFIQSQYSMVQEILKVSIRKVTVCVYYETLGAPQEVMTVAYFTDPAAMDKVLSGLGSQDLDDASSGGSGSSGSGSGSSGTGRPTSGTRQPTRDNRGGSK